MEDIKIIEDGLKNKTNRDIILVTYHLTTTFQRLFLYELSKRREVEFIAPVGSSVLERTNMKNELIMKREHAYKMYIGSVNELKRMYPNMKEKKLLRLLFKYKDLPLAKVQGVYAGCVILLSMMDGKITREEAEEKLQPMKGYFDDMVNKMNRMAVNILK